MASTEMGSRRRPGHPYRVDPAFFEDAANFDVRYVPELDRIAEIVAALRSEDLRVVLTSGSFDILHEGHSMYLEAAKRMGDFLVVGVDSDDKIRKRKGPGRPAVPELERLRLVTHQRGVGMVTLKRSEHPHWALIKTVRPDVLVVTEDAYTDAEREELGRDYCGKVVVLPRMATVSTSARLRLLQLQVAERLSTEVSAQLPTLLRRITDELMPPST